MKRKSLVALTLLLATGLTAIGENYFVDGYHGGIYGHFPVEWKTAFMVETLRQNPEWRICLEIEPETWDTVQVRTPEAYRAFAEMMKSGRMEVTNPTYAQPYCYNIGGESIIRQFQYGMDKIDSHFPGVTYTTYAVEEPCFTSCLPGILSQLGFKYASLKCPNTCWGGYMAAHGGEFVNWIGPDGSRLVTVPRYGCERLEDNSVWQTIAWGNQKKYWDACREAGMKNPVGMTFQDAGWRNGPWIKRHPRGVQYTLWTEYMDRFAPESAPEDYRLTQDDVCVNLMWGSQVLQRIARQVRQAENRMVMAEKMGAIGLLDGVEGVDQKAIDEAWRQLMLAQHHDSWIVPYNGLWHFGTWADAIALWTGNATSTANGEMERLAKKMGGEGKYAMVKVFNTQGYERDEVVEMDLPEGWPADKGVELTDSRGKRVKAYVVKGHNADKTKVNRLYFKATVPPIGYATYQLRVAYGTDTVDASDSPGGASADNVVLESDMVRLVVNLGKGGTVNSLVLKNGKHRDFAPAEGSEYAMGEIRGYFYDEDCFHSSAEHAARVTGYVDNPLVKSVTIEGKIGKHPFTQTYTLKKGDTKIDCDLHIDWQGNPGIGEYRERRWRDDRRGFCDDRYKLCVLLPTSFQTPRLLKDAPFDVCESRDEDTFFNRWSEIKHNVILNWADACAAEDNAGIGVITDHTTSYVHGKDYPLGLTVQYSGQGLWGPNYRIDRPTDVHYAIVPHSGDADNIAVMEDAADRFNEQLQAYMCGGNNRPTKKSLLQLDQPGYRVSAALRDGDDNLKVRLYNSHAADAPVKMSVQLPAATMAPVDLRGNVTGTQSVHRAGNGVESQVEMPHYAFRTYEVKPVR